MPACSADPRLPARERVKHGEGGFRPRGRRPLETTTPASAPKTHDVRTARAAARTRARASPAARACAARSGRKTQALGGALGRDLGPGPGRWPSAAGYDRARISAAQQHHRAAPSPRAWATREDRPNRSCALLCALPCHFPFRLLPAGAVPRARAAARDAAALRHLARQAAPCPRKGAAVSAVWRPAASWLAAAAGVVRPLEAAPASPREAMAVAAVAAPPLAPPAATAD